MAAFTLQIGTRTIETDADAIDIGTRSSCALSIRDSIASSQHAWIRRRDGLYYVEDAGTATGTWHNGELVTKPVALADGDVIVVGTTKIDVKIEPSTLRLVVAEQSFFFETSRQHKVVVGKKADGTDDVKTIVGGDAERWVRDETLFGRFPILRPLNVAAAAAGLALIVWLALPAGRKEFLQPAELHAKHALLFDRGMPKDAAPQFVAGRAVADAQGCAACHETFGGVPNAKCAQCHAQLMTENHPFVKSRSTAGPASSIAIGEDACATCHMDHQGRSPAEGVFTPTALAVAGSCATCHANEVPKETLRKPTEIAKADYAIPYDAFPHKSHAEVACNVCHVQSPPAERSLVSDRDFARVPFETCMRCHAAAEKPGAASGTWSRDAALANYWQKVKPEHRVSLAWHGAGKDDASSRCLDCHAKVHDAALREIETQRADQIAFTLRRRTHAELFAGHANVVDASGKSRTCTECHATGSPSLGETKEGRFWHALHMKSVTPGTGANERSLSVECAQCHTEQTTSKHLAGRPMPADGPSRAANDVAKPSDAYLGADARSCAQCHKDEKGAALVLRGEVSPTAPSVKRRDFPHAPHVTRAHEPASPTHDPLANGCYSCHSFPASDAPFRAMPITNPEASSCLSCHKSHANVGGDGCALCHPNTPDGKADLVYAGKPAQRRRAETSGFSHTSPGHRASTESSCETCHDGARQALRVSDVPIPSESDESCWKCHVLDRQRFHWRGAKVALDGAPPPTSK